MKTIFVVYYDWAFNDGSSEGYVGIYENREDAIKRMEQYWEDEKAMEYFGLNALKWSRKLGLTGTTWENTPA